MKMPLLSRKHFPKIAPAWKSFLLLYGFFTIISTFSSTFINTFLLKATGDNNQVPSFYIVLGAVQPFAMLVAVYIIRLRSALFSQALGFALYAAGFLALSILQQRAAANVLWIGAVFSAANGFFFTTYALQLLEYVTDDTRDSSYGLQNALGGLIGILLPSVTGFLLARFSDFTGYTIIFMLGLIVSIASIVVVFRLEPLTNVAQRPQLGHALHTLIFHRAARAAMLASAANGFYSGTMTFYLNMLMYAIVSSEAVIGVAQTLASIAAILSSLVYSRIVRPENRKKAILLSLTATIVAAITLSAAFQLIPLIAFNTLLSVTSVFFLTPVMTAYVGAIERIRPLAGLGSEVHALREFWYGTGRVLGILTTMLLSDLRNGAIIAIVIILGVQMLPALLMDAMQENASEEPNA